MLGSYQLLVIIKLILFEALELMCIEDDSFRRYRRIRSSSDSNNPPGTPFIIISVSVDDYFAILNCSTPEKVSYENLDWYFQSHYETSPRVIWQSGRTIAHRYYAFSPDQSQHFLRIKPVTYNDSGTYLCVDQTSGFQNAVELIIRDSRSCAGSVIRLHLTMLVAFVLLSLFLSRRTASESQVT